MQPLLQSRQQRLKKCEDYAYLISTKWLRDWKDYTGYDSLYSENSSQSDKKMGKRNPGIINADLIVNNNDYFDVPEELEEYEYLNIVVNEKYDIDDEFIAVDK